MTVNLLNVTENNVVLDNNDCLLYTGRCWFDIKIIIAVAAIVFLDEICSRNGILTFLFFSISREVEGEKLLSGGHFPRRSTSDGSGYSRAKDPSVGHRAAARLCRSDHQSRVAVHAKLRQTCFGLDTGKTVSTMLLYSINNDRSRADYNNEKVTLFWKKQ